MRSQLANIRKKILKIPPSANSQDDTDIRFHLTFLAQNMSISTEVPKIYVVCGPERKIFLSF